MGIMKRAVEMMMYGSGHSTAFKIAFGFLPEPPPEPTKEERAAAREAAREAKAERAAIQAVEREQEEERRMAEEAARPRVFAPDPPDFPRSRRDGSTETSREAEVLSRAPTELPGVARMAAMSVGAAAYSPSPVDPAHADGLSSPLSYGRVAASDRAALEDVRGGRIGPGMAALREELGPPEPAAVPTGWYMCGPGYYRVGGGPYPEYRPPGLKWRTYWTIPKPDDVPWDDGPTPTFLDPDAAARLDDYRAELLAKDRRLRDPTGAREPAGKLDQLRFVW